MNRKSAAHAQPVSIWFALAALALLPASGFAQIETGRPQFDAASVRVNESGDRPFTRYDPIRADLRKASIKHLVRRAWQLPDYQIVWPEWVDARRGRRGYDVSVTFPPDTSPKLLNLMFQDLLVTRFGLVTHWETRELKVFEVRVSEQGSKLQKAKSPAPPTDFPKYTTKTESGLWHFSSQLGRAPSGLTVAGFLEAIDATHILDRPLVDPTAYAPSDQTQLCGFQNGALGSLRLGRLGVRQHVKHVLELLFLKVRSQRIGQLIISEDIPAQMADAGVLLQQPVSKTQLLDDRN